MSIIGATWFLVLGVSGLQDVPFDRRSLCMEAATAITNELAAQGLPTMVFCVPRGRGHGPAVEQDKAEVTG